MQYNGIDLSLLQYACEIIADSNDGLSGSQIIKYSNSFAVEYGVQIPFSNLTQLRTAVNKRSILFSNLKSFNSKQQTEILKFLCNLEYKKQVPILELKKKLSLRLGDAFGENVTTTELVKETRKELSKYPSALKVYEESLSKYKEGKYVRNILDDMRLSLELLLKSVLNNEKSLENQKSDLGSLLKQKGISNEIRNTFMTIVDYYSKYQNDNVKHNDLVNELEIEYIIEQTSVLIRFLIKVSR